MPPAGPNPTAAPRQTRANRAVSPTAAAIPATASHQRAGAPISDSPGRSGGQAPGGERGGGLADQFLYDFGDRLFGGDHTDRLTRHDRSHLDVAIDYRAAQRASPEVLDRQLRGVLVQFAGLEFIARLGLVTEECLGALVHQTPHWNNGEPLIELDGWQRVAGVGADEGLLEIRVRDRLDGRREAGAKLSAGRAHLQISQDGVTSSQPACDEHRDFPN